MEPRLPVGPTHDRDGTSGARRVVFGTDQAADRGHQPQNWKIISGDKLADHSLGLRTIGAHFDLGIDRGTGQGGKNVVVVAKVLETLL